MIEETATVVRCDGDYAWVATTRKSACNACAVNKGCGTSLLSKVVGNKPTQLRVVNNTGAMAGDEVTIGIHETAMLRGATLLYLVPILALFGSALLGELLAEQWHVEAVELFTIVFGIVGFMSSIRWVRRYTERFASDPRYQAVILDKPKTL